MRVCAFELLGEVVSPFDRIGGDDEILVGIERLSDHELIPVMIAADRGALVVHGPALKAFHALAATPDVTERLQKFSKLDVTLSASGNKMASQKVALADLLPASSRRPKVAWCASGTAGRGVRVSAAVMPRAGFHWPGRSATIPSTNTLQSKENEP
jgi:hypothetical protein